MCVCERERKKEGAKEKDREREERGRKKERVGERERVGDGHLEVMILPYLLRMPYIF